MSNRFVVRNAVVCNGVGEMERKKDVAVENGRIVAVEMPDANLYPDWPTVNGEGLVLAPGFIDVHSHSDSTIFKYPGAQSKISQGITTEIVGNCGISDACKSTEVNGTRWNDVASYGEAINRLKPALNVGTLAGHGTLRTNCLGAENLPMTPEVIQKMTSELKRSLEQGALGLSSGLVYIPGKFASQDEMKTVASALKGTGKPYVTHMRSEDNTVLEALEEAKEIATAGDGILQISHIKTMDPWNWYKIDGMLESIYEGRRQGLRIAADRYPYLYSSKGLRWCLPEPFSSIPLIYIYLKKHAEAKAEILAAWKKAGEPNWERIILSDSDDISLKEFWGISLMEIGRRLGTSPAEACIDILARCKNSCSAMYGRMCQENMERFLGQEWVMPGTDGYSVAELCVDERYHPRSFGTFPRYVKVGLKYAALPELVRRMSAAPAKMFNLKNKGYIKVGYDADLVLFNPQEMNAEMDFANPHKLSTGVYKVFVAGQLSYDRNDLSVVGNAGRFVK